MIFCTCLSETFHTYRISKNKTKLSMLHFWSHAAKLLNENEILGGGGQRKTYFSKNFSDSRTILFSILKCKKNLNWKHTSINFKDGIYLSQMIPFSSCYIENCWRCRFWSTQKGIFFSVRSNKDKSIYFLSVSGSISRYYGIRFSTFWFEILIEKNMEAS